MSELRLLAAACLALACARALPEQQDAALLARRDSLRARADSLYRRFQALEASERETGLTAEMQVGPLRLRTTAALQPAATAAFTQAVADARRVLGADADSLAGHLRLTLRENRRTSRYRWIPVVGRVLVDTTERIVGVSLEGLLDGRHVPGVSLTYPVDRDELAASALSLMERALASRLPAPIEPWLDHRVPLRASPPEFGPDLFRTLATSEAAVVRRCAAGDRTACRLGFALDSVPSDRVTAWYDASDLPALARLAAGHIQRTGMTRAISRDEEEDCLVQRQLQICRRMVALLPAGAFGIPMPGAARASLMRLAFEMGGARGIERLRATTDTTIGGQLAAVAGVPANALLSRWMEQLIEARPSSPLPNVTFVLASLACIAVCLGWAMRGRPWN
ncbi:MAG: hypothetical protein Q8K55_08920 [Gemmatimonadaceae bacterium]|nr:hypothetical protein [Gemmatimonadaceae bacterium]